MKEKLEKLKELCDLFKSNIKEYKSSKYDESNTRTEFIDKFFELLDWDIRNLEGNAENYKDVVREDKVVIEGKPKAPDYSFRIGGIRKFFLEAKKPSVNIKDDHEPAFQVRRYGYTAKLSLCVLTNFDSLAIYDTRIKPIQNDKSSVARIHYFQYEDYEKNFEFIYNILSKKAILKGSFDKYITESKNKKGTSEVDKEFLYLIEDWRENLAKNIALRNKDLDIYSLNQAVQTIIDRIIFLRIAEDRNIEKYGMLLNACNDGMNNRSNVPTYSYIDGIFKNADKKYNSGLFKIEKWISNLSIDDKILQSIIRNLYYPECPYELSVLPIEILGNIYEQFLGKTIRLTPSHQAKVEEKEEVRKAGGVYYTPQYIVNYIVQNTIGEKIKDVDLYNHPKLTVLDPACGSGSFLVGAYSFLLERYLEAYTEKKRRDKCIKNGLIYPISENTYRLSIKVKQHILLNHIFGVDIDHQAVEVTKLSLLLKLMEDENSESADQLFKHSDIKLLPDLSNNIKCGNSLIGSDFYNDKDLNLFGKEEMRKVNTFDWENEFPEAFKNGGFDIVIGNPPYIRIQGLTENHSRIIPYLKNRYFSAQAGNIDIYVIFLEKILGLINTKGMTGYILPHKFFQADMGSNIRDIISKKQAIYKILNFGHIQIFDNATTYTCLFFMSGFPNQSFSYAKIETDKLDKSLSDVLYQKISSDELSQEKWNFYSDKKGELLEKLNSFPVKLGDITRKIFVGLQTSADKIYVLKKTKNTVDGSILKLYSQSLEKEIEIEKDFVKPFLMGKNVKRYEEPIYKGYVIFPYILKNGKAELMSQDFIKERYSLGWEYLLENKKVLEKREKEKFKDTWWQFGRLNNLSEFENIKLLTPEISYGCNMTIDSSGSLYHTTKVYSIIFNDNQKESKLFFLGILNSKVLWFFLKSTGYVLRGGFFTFKTNYLNPFPIPKIDLSNKNQKSHHDKMVSLVDSMLSTQKQLHEAINDSDKKLLQQKCNLLDNQIDKLVYELYGLTEDEIKIVEGK